MSNHNRPKQNNYFERNIKNLGPNFLQTKNAMNLQFEAIMMFRDLVRGRIDVREYEEYFRDPQFLDSCIHAASQKQTFYSISFAGVSLYANQGSSDPMILAVLDYHQKAAAGYQLLHQGLEAFKLTGQIELLLPIAGQLRNYRDYI